ncbi:acetyl-CoA carboxylase carboxyltransferase subunit alpha [Paracrocinitomix mangrovi]|uniref:acetyl-CoA carboxylase carboxyltransferase subunit alpha n=1 Tax=Paracrocinitomix mangrovi TaxID=2862509 RepID=UPI001C8E7211|nr:acetyl-CoA carboxylase carboxyltransferase subunit alpha [Paracrocinitomix mangrovi]UKN02464.1 acetyl-CoA carboxylase carboxyltransferase subunit alpha [Paracrocinitomix mangrovi]
MSNYLPFEEPIAKIVEEIEKAKEIEANSGVNSSKMVKDLEKKLKDTTKDIFAKLTPWQRVQLSRHPDRPYSLEYINYLTDGTFIELHGDRNVKDDKAMVGGFGQFNGQTVMFVGQQKGTNTKMRQYRNFGMPNPEGYRKALRLFRLAEKFNKPIVTLIDTPGAFPGLEAEERGQGEAIARNIYEMMNLKVPVICIIIGEGASGGALGIGVGDKVIMLENSWYSVISPENCSTILWRSWDFKEKAAEALKLTSTDMKALKIVDEIIKEPIGGAHRFREETFKNVKDSIIKNLESLSKMDARKRMDERIDKFCQMGVFKGK